VIFSFIYWVIRPFGAPAQAGFGVGTRVMQAIFLPAMAVAFSVAPIVGQNFGAHRFERVRATVWSAAWMSALLMLLAMFVVQWRAPALIRAFNRGPSGGAGGRRLPEVHFLELPVQRLHFHLLRRAAGPGQHLALAVGFACRASRPSSRRSCGYPHSRTSRSPKVWIVLDHLGDPAGAPDRRAGHAKLKRQAVPSAAIA